MTLALALAGCGGDNDALDTSAPAPGATIATSSPAATSHSRPGDLRDAHLSVAWPQLGTFVDGATGWIVTGVTLLSTTDAGVHWTAMYTFSTAPTDIDFVDKRTGWATTDGIMKTVDGGSTWGLVNARITILTLLPKPMVPS